MLGTGLLASGCQLLFSLDNSPDAQLGGDAVAEQCPSTYDVGPATGPYVYRLVVMPRNYADAKIACELEVPGRSTLAELSDDTARGQILDALLAVGQRNVWVAARQGASSTVDGGWAWERSRLAVADALWALDEPNDSDSMENNEQQVAAVAPDLRGLRDLAEATLAFSLCECAR